MSDMSNERLLAIVRDLIHKADETEIVEFKENQNSETMIGKLISALSNSAAVQDKRFAYVIWGVHDADRAVVGTRFSPENEMVGNQGLQIWLSSMLDPAPNYRFETIQLDGRKVVVLKIPAASVAPVEFQRRAYVRVGSATPALSDHRQLQRSLWAKLQTFAWETAVAADFVLSKDVIKLLDYKGYLERTGQAEASDTEDALSRMVADELIVKVATDRYDILNLGAILFANALSDFGSEIQRKGLRFVRYDGEGRNDPTILSGDGNKGYAEALTGFTPYIINQLPVVEKYVGAVRKEEKLLPELAIRELLANALIHQDMMATGSGPMVELFINRLEISNPGDSLVPPKRFLDAPPRSRNEQLARMMRRMGLCEERGTGVEKVISEAERYLLPPPEFRQKPNAVRTILHAPRVFSEMSQDERLSACYQHAALLFKRGHRMTNSSLRLRFGLEDTGSSRSQMSKVIRAAQDEGDIKPYDSASPRSGYVPVWDE